VFTKTVPLFTLLGFRVSVDLSWIILALLVTWTLAAGAFPMLYPDLASWVYWAMGVAGMLGLVFSIVVHEFAHSLVARYYDMPMRGITLFIFGGVAEMEAEPPSAKAEFWVAIVGPIASFIVAAAFQVLAIGTAAAGGPVSVSGVLAYLAMINVVLAVFNLVPAFPLDGGRVLRAALWGWKGSYIRATRIATSAGGTFGVLLMVLAVVNILAGNFVPGMWWFLLGLFVRGAAQGTMQQTMVSEALSDVPIRRFMTTDPITVEPSLSVDKLVDGFFYKHYHKLYPVMEGSRLAGCVNLEDVKQVPREEWTERSVGDIMRDCSDENTVEPDAEAVKVLRRMMQSGVPRMLVVEDGRLVGIVAQSEIMRFLAVKMDLEAGGGPSGIPAPGSPRRSESPAGA
jgi:Zn-dependent protease/CBS domain-containing protein